MFNGPNIVILAVIVFFLIAGLQLVLSMRRHGVLAYLLPTCFLFLAGYNLYKSLFVYNPHPTMAEGIYMALGLFGFASSTLILLICRVYQGRKAGE